MVLIRVSLIVNYAEHIFMSTNYISFLVKCLFMFFDFYKLDLFITVEILSMYAIILYVAPLLDMFLALFTLTSLSF